jgi:hypothetical protein
MVACRQGWRASISADIVRSRYISLTTFRKDGGGVATPVWHAAKGDELFVVSDAGAWRSSGFVTTVTSLSRSAVSAARSRRVR